MTISLRTLVLAAAALVVAGVVAFVAVARSSDTTLAPRGVKPVFAPPAAPDTESTERPPAPGQPIATVAGSAPGTQLSLMSLRRTGPKVVTARLRIDFDDGPNKIWVPHLYEPDDQPWSAEGMRLIDEVNGREHFVLRDADGACLCSGRYEALETGESSVISAKFPAPPANVTHASLETPGFASFDAVPLA